MSKSALELLAKVSEATTVPPPGVNVMFARTPRADTMFIWPKPVAVALPPIVNIAISPIVVNAGALVCWIESPTAATDDRIVDPFSKTAAPIVGEDDVQLYLAYSFHLSTLPAASVLAGIVSEPLTPVGEPKIVASPVSLATAVQLPHEKMHPPNRVCPDARPIENVP